MAGDWQAKKKRKRLQSCEGKRPLLWFAGTATVESVCVDAHCTNRQCHSSGRHHTRNDSLVIMSTVTQRLRLIQTLARAA
jgi:hypothetical protein